MDLGAHLPLMEFGDEGQSLGRLQAAVDAARDCGFAAVSTNDHFFFATPVARRADGARRRRRPHAAT